MEQVLIVAKTKMSGGVCLGGLVLKDDYAVRSVRLIPPERYFFFDKETPLNLGEIWEIQLTEKPEHEIEAPHTEDILAIPNRRVRKLTSREQIDMIRTYRDVPLVSRPQELFDGKLQIGIKGKGSVRSAERMPLYSTGFWRLTKDLTLTYDNEDKSKQKPRYVIVDDNFMSFDVPYVGLEMPLDAIPASTILRFSLARNRASADNRRVSSLQLSGWFL